MLDRGEPCEPFGNVSVLCGGVPRNGDDSFCYTAHVAGFCVVREAVKVGVVLSSELAGLLKSSYGLCV